MLGIIYGKMFENILTVETWKCYNMIKTKIGKLMIEYGEEGVPATLCYLIFLVKVLHI